MDTELRDRLRVILSEHRMRAYKTGNRAVLDVCDSVEDAVENSLRIMGVVGDDGVITWADGNT